ncbi:DUF4405 domain-containing protein [Pseudothioclava nitratireducens]|uniref:DUF4405 domain-containing protein n=1 Tax=Pseudothioclava nitratireducens TaxID=1928646 RepID=UPI0023DC04F7|nr:DUF4405 domain-containing protein [Defluviimonas nitratireducens]MDF1620790.1 DUF4405 domain-containing protein [Defluviimonas nitratireducens]
MTLRAWATPLVIGSFLVMAVTGSLMFFHLEFGMMKQIHEFAGFAMVAGGLAHLVLNWRAFTLYFRRPVGSAIMALGAVVLGLSMMLSGGEAGGNPMVRVMGVMGQSRVAQLAELSGQEPQAVLAALKEAGFEAADTQQTVGALAGGDRGRQAAILNTIFAQTGGSN